MDELETIKIWNKKTQLTVKRANFQFEEDWDEEDADDRECQWTEQIEQAHCGTARVDLGRHA